MLRLFDGLEARILEDMGDLTEEEAADVYDAREAKYRIKTNVQLTRRWR